MSLFDLKPNYSIEELEDAINSISIEDAYDMVTNYYMKLNFPEEYNQERIDGETYQKYEKEVTERTPFKLLHIEGIGDNIGTELLGTKNKEYNDRFRKACIRVDYDYRTGEGDLSLIERFGEVFPIPFMAMLFRGAIDRNDDAQLEAIINAGNVIFPLLDEEFKLENPKAREKAIQKMQSYSVGIFEGLADEYKQGINKSKFEDVVKLFTSLPNKFKKNYNVYLGFQMCFNYSQDRVLSIDEYMHNKKLFFTAALGLHNTWEEPTKFFKTNMPDEMLMTTPCYVPFENASYRLLGTTLNDNPSSQQPSQQIEMAKLLISIDAEERKKCDYIKEKHHKEQTIVRSNPIILEYANDLIRKNMDSVDKAVDYLRIHYKPGKGYIIPDPKTIQKIVIEFGNAPQVKEHLFRDCPQINRLWEEIPFGILPEEYTTFEKMLAGVQIITNDIRRAIGTLGETKKSPEIPEDIRKRIFDSRDCITSILFPGISYSYEVRKQIPKIEIGTFDHNQSANMLLIRTLHYASSQVMQEDFIRGLVLLYTEYFERKVGAYKFVDKTRLWDYLYSTLPVKIPGYTQEPGLSGILPFLIQDVIPLVVPPVFKQEPINLNKLDGSSEYDVEGFTNQYPIVSGYPRTEYYKAKALLTIPDCIGILSSYYECNKQITREMYRKMKLDIPLNGNEQDESGRMLACECRLPGRGDLLGKAAICIEESVHRIKELSEDEVNLIIEFVKTYGRAIPPGFISRLNSALHYIDKPPIVFKDENLYFAINKDDPIILACIKYFWNEPYRDTHELNIFKLAQVINGIPYDKYDFEKIYAKGLQHLLMAMVACFAKANYKVLVFNYNNNENIKVSNEIEKANETAINMLLRMGLAPYDYDRMRAVHLSKDYTEYYPMDKRLAESMLNNAFSSVCQQAQMASSDLLALSEMKSNIMKIIGQQEKRASILFKNLSPDAILKWDVMPENTLLKMLIIMGRNDIDVLSKVSQAIEPNSTTIQEANPNLSPERIERYKARLANVMNEIFNSGKSEYIKQLIGGKAIAVPGFPNHKQSANTYYSKLISFLQIRQLTDKSVLEVFKEDFETDKRCQIFDEANVVNGLKNKAQKRIKDLYQNSQRPQLGEGPADPE